MALGRIAVIGIAAVVLAGSAVAFVIVAPPGNVGSQEVASTSVARNTDAPSIPVPVEPVRDVLLQQTYALTPVSVELPLLEYAFQVEKEYSMLQVDLFGPQGAYAEAMPSIKILDPEGEVAAEWTHDSVFYTVPSVPTVYEARPFTVASISDVKLGEYKVEVSGASNPFELTVLGLKGLAFDFALKDALGKGTVRLSEMTGKAVLVDLFATWCGPCKEAMRTFAELYDDYDRAQFEILSVDTDRAENENDIRKLFEAKGWNWYGGMDDGSVDKNYGSGYIPTMALVDAAGNLMYRHIGTMKEEQLRELIDQAIARAGKPVNLASTVGLVRVTEIRLETPVVNPGDPVRLRAEVSDPAKVSSAFFTLCRAVPEPYTCFAKLPLKMEGTDLVGTTAGAKEVPALERGWEMRLHVFVTDTAGERHEFPKDPAGYTFTVGSSATSVPGFETFLGIGAIGAIALAVRRRS